MEYTIDVGRFDILEKSVVARNSLRELNYVGIKKAGPLWCSEYVDEPNATNKCIALYVQYAYHVSYTYAGITSIRSVNVITISKYWRL